MPCIFSSADVIYDNTEDVSEIPVFLNIEKLIAIALKTNANAVHPGYGFPCRERFTLRKKCGDNKIIFHWSLRRMPFIKWEIKQLHGRLP